MIKPVDVNAAALLELQSIEDGRGILVVAEAERHVSFPIRRVFAMTGVGSGGKKGGHAHKELNQVLVCLSGAVDVRLDDGRATRTERLDTPARALYIPPLIWADQQYEDERTVLMVLCDEYYEEADYLRDYDAFLRFRAGI